VEDHTFPKEARQVAIDILQSGQKSYQLQLFSGVEHGFALRGNMKNPYERMAPLSAIYAQLNSKTDIF
jgi:dienelactone hydrolase